MKNFVFIIFLSIFCMQVSAQTEFVNAATAFENNDNEKALSILSQIEANVGANPKIESLRSLTYHQMGDVVKAYSSILRYFELAINNRNSSENSTMESLKTELKITLENELRQKQEQIINERNKMSNTIINSKETKKRSASKEKQKAFDEFYDNKINNTKTDFTADEIITIKENIKTKTAEGLNVKTLKIAVLKFSDILYIGQDENVIVDAVYDKILNQLQTDETLRAQIKKERKIKFKIDADYYKYLNGLKEDLRGFFRIESIGSYNEKRNRMGNMINDKYLIYLYNAKLDCNLKDAAPFADEKSGEVDPYYIYTQNGKLAYFGGIVSISSDIKDFTNSSGLNLKNVNLINNELEKKYGSMTVKIDKTEQERNYAKYLQYSYTYTVKTNSFYYNLNYFFRPYGYENGNRDVISGSVLGYISFNIGSL
ncbi:hypothetical protein ACM55F_11625 [Flavobacterium sp. XS2P12]|uniref:hypothetical protein n=1 Tax=Flavobacterium melibiosi TaxID=3398734 RepID=UPI003A85E62B